MKVLITGASGCVGRQLVSRLAAAGMETIALSRQPVPGAAATIAVDLGDPSFISKLPARCDAIIHAAQSRRYREFPAGAKDMYAVNTAATFHLADYAREAGARAFIFTSTGTVYAPHSGPVGEGHATILSNLYAASKLASEMLIKPYGSLMNVLSVRLFYVYGPGQAGNLIDGLAQRIRSGTPVTLQGDEGILLCPTFAGDVAALLVTAVERSWTGVLNIASPRVHSLKSIAVAIGSALGVEPTFEHAGAAPPAPLLPDTKRLQELCPDFAFTALEEGLQQTL